MIRGLAVAVMALVLTACGVVALPGWIPTTLPSIPWPTASTSRPATGSAKDPVSGLRWMTVSELPSQGRTVYHQIAAGGPFDYAKDGSTFFNNERLLPKKSRGYYREYTVPTPGSSDRGARRIVCGGQPRTSVAECYYTADHYRTFRRIRP